MKRKLNYISNLGMVEVSGGGSSVNVATYTQLSRYFEMNYIGPVHVSLDRLAKFKSNVFRAIGLKGNYHFFSEKRLQQLSLDVSTRLSAADGSSHFFHGITPWINYKSSLPYYAYTDACFATYVDVFNNRNEFSPSDLDRIYKKEAEWITKAERIFFRSQWALEQTVRHYAISRNNLEVVGLGAFIPIPEVDVYNGERTFLFISKEFVPKGGVLCVTAFKELLVHYPDIKLKIIGDPPPEGLIEGWDAICYVGFLRKENEKQFKLLQQEISRAFALIHPTMKDTNALVITEAGYYGCPSIASDSFAISEFIQDKRTGLLLGVPLNVEELRQKMEYLLEYPDHYQAMRRNVRNFTLSTNTWDKVGERLAKHINRYA